MAWLLPRDDDDRGDIPAEIYSYQAFCQTLGVEPYPRVPSTFEDLDRCYAQQALWEAERADYAATHRIAELEFAEEQWPHDYWDPRQV